ncbi:molybdopterin-dependent oxidoreductase [Euzebya rosea]|uniref:molybdopterin-dependent oxidoreductase n=1 Tax=Euzebya rosea TaxID=2052804 RepID=UPI000D3E895F|nr:molybdopterin-dependent oxidoreductase [Euzebya rosea]
MTDPTHRDDPDLDDPHLDDQDLDGQHLDEPDEVVGFLHGGVDPAPTVRERRAQAFAAQARAETTRVSRAVYVQRTRRSVLTGAAGVAALGLGWGWLLRAPEDGNIPWPLRRGFEWNETVWSTLYDPGRLAPEFDVTAAEDIRVNGTIGLDPPLDEAAWRLRVEGPDGQLLDELDLADVLDGASPVHQVTEHKCIEGWSAVVAWEGIRFADFAGRYESLLADTGYVQLVTPDEAYYVGLDADTAMHPQTLLATGLNGQPLTSDHGAPLRLVTPLHYGIKALKRIGTIRFTTDRPADYWAERGYDWDSSH